MWRIDCTNTLLNLRVPPPHSTFQIPTTSLILGKKSPRIIFAGTDTQRMIGRISFPTPIYIRVQYCLYDTSCLRRVYITELERVPPSSPNPQGLLYRYSNPTRFCHDVIYVSMIGYTSFFGLTHPSGISIFPPPHSHCLVSYL